MYLFLKRVRSKPENKPNQSDMANRNRLPASEYINGIQNGDRYLLSRAITLVESNLPADHQLSQEVLQHVMPLTGNATRIGITGVPGVGKSTFIESFGKFLADAGHRVAVLAVDPTSQRTGGSIMGDKTRMERLAHHPKAYIRPSASGSSLGGVARKTRESMLLCEAAGFNVILVETVGVGQSEVTVRGMVDFFLLLMLAGAGDELQGIKKGIMEMADALVINKADGDNIQKAKLAKAEYQNALHLFRPGPSGWSCPVQLCSSLKETGIDQVWETVEAYYKRTKGNGWFARNRELQNLQWMRDSIREELINNFYNNPGVKSRLLAMEERVARGKAPAYLAAQQLIELYSQGQADDHRK